jgi:hypothetical protein
LPRENGDQNGAGGERKNERTSARDAALGSIAECREHRVGLRGARCCGNARRLLPAPQRIMDPAH